MKIIAPGKLILSGEHAVVHGHPAIAMAVDRYVTITLSAGETPFLEMVLKDLAHHSRFNLATLKQLKTRLKRKYQRFVQGEYTIRQVIKKPFELAQFALGVCAEALDMGLPSGMTFNVHSSIPVGCGMGSSAATILCVMTALMKQMDVQLPPETVYQLALEAENMQHGSSSGLDLRVAQMGGCLHLQNQTYQKRPFPFGEMYLVNTGTPISTTGECVAKTSPYFRQSTIGRDFAAITEMMSVALMGQNESDIKLAMRENHNLLTQIGVVPKKVQHFIQTIEDSGAAAKSMWCRRNSGDHAGIVWIVGGNTTALKQICDNYSYQLETIKGEESGVHSI